MTARMNDDQALARIKANPLQQDCQQLCDLAALDAIPGFLVCLIQPEIKLAIAKNPKTAPDFLARLALDEDDDVRETVAGNPHTPGYALQKLARDKNLDVRTALVKNPATPGAALGYLANDIYESIRSAVANHPNTPGKVLLQLQKFIPQYERKSRLAAAADRGDSEAEDLEDLARSTPIKVKPPIDINEADLPPATLEIRRAVAAYPQTPSPVLKQLATDKDVEVRVNVAGHPHITEEIIEILARDVVLVKKALARNPLTQPHILEQLSHNSLLGLAITENPRTPPQLRDRLLTKLIRSADQLPAQEKIDTLTSIVINPHTPPDIVTGLVLEEGSDMRAVFASNPLTPQYILKLLGKEKNISVCSSLAGNPRTPEHILRRLAEHKDNWIKTQIAQNPNTPLNILEEMASRGESVIALCQNPRLPWSILQGIYTEKGSLSGVYTNLAGNPNTPPEILDELAAPNRHESINKAVAANPNTRPDTLERLAKDIYAQHVVAANPHTPPETLAELVRDDRYRNISPIVAKNPGAPLEVLQQIHEWQEAQKLNIGVRSYIASHPYTPATDLQTLAADETPEVRTAVAGNCNSDAEGTLRDRSIFELLLKDECAAVRLALAKNPSTPVDLLEELIEDRETDVRLAVSNHPQGLPLLLAGFVKSGVEFTRLVALLHPQIPPAILSEKVHSPHWWERWATHQENL